MDSLLTVALSNAVVAVLLAIVALIAGRVLRRPALTHGLWLLVLLKLLTPPLVRIPMPWPETELPAVAIAAQPPSDEIVVRVDLDDALPEAEPLAEEPNDAGIPEESPLAAAPPVPTTRDASSSSLDGMTILAICWLSGSTLWLLLALKRMRSFHRLLRYSTPAPSWLLDEVAALARRLGLGRTPAVLLVPGKVSPMLWSLGGSPRLLLPADLLAVLTAEQRATLLIHELAHLHRRDHWVRGLELVASALYWWHPVVWWARHELREAEEQCCDAWVVWALPEAGRAYADALVSCLDFLSDAPAPLPVGASGLGHIADLKRRLTMILKGTTPRRLTWGGVAAVLGLGLLLLPLLPSRAQDRKEPPDPREVEKAREEVEKLKHELMEQMKKVKAAEEKLREAAERLGRAEGKGDERVRIVIIREGEKHDMIRPQIEIERRIERGPGGQHPPSGGQRIERFPPDRGPERPFPPAATLRAGGEDRRIQDLERALQNVMRELEEMKRHMRGGPGSGQNERKPATTRPPQGGPMGGTPPAARTRELDRDPTPRPEPRPQPRPRDNEND
jgi:beta-lactamase regulating signal transducer with metallopeptidase domain